MPRDVASRAIKREVDAGRGVGPIKNGVYLDFAESIERLGPKAVEERYSNLFEMYERITDESPEKVPMRIYPAVHYTMGGLWVDYDLMSNVPGLFVLGEANFSDHGANRLGAERADAGARRRLLRAAVHDRQLPGPAARLGAGRHRRPGLRRSRGGGARRGQAAPVDERHPLGRLVPPRARQDRVGQLRDGAQHREPREGARGDPAPCGSSSTTTCVSSATTSR